MEKLLDLINSWLKHAESKNGVLIALLGVLIPFLIDRIKISNGLSIIDYWLIFFTCSSLIAIILAIITFIPSLVTQHQKRENMPKKVNPYFFGHIQYLKPEELVELISEKKEMDKNDLYIAEQVINNSIITYRKFKIFELAIWVVFIGFAMPVALILLIIKKVMRNEQ